MSGFIEYDVALDQAVLEDQAFEALEEKFPGYQTSDAHLENALLVELVRIVRETGQVAANVPPAIFRAFGLKIAGIPPKDATPATATVTITAVDDAGYALPAGTQFLYQESGDQFHAFELTDGIAIPQFSTEVVGAPIQAVEEGTALNDIPAGTVLTPVLGFKWIDEITLDTATTGGDDGEGDALYLHRLSDELRLMGPKPVLPSEYAVLARRVAGVYRALARDLYDPDTDTFDNERTVALAAVDELGDAIGAATKDALSAFLAATRELNFLVKVFDPTYTRVDVTFNATALPGFNAAQVEISAEEAVSAHLDPASWGRTDLKIPNWQLTPTVSHLEIAVLLNDVPGLDVVSLLELGKEGGAQAAADVALDGAAPLPRRVDGTPGASTVIGTVVAP